VVANTVVRDIGNRQVKMRVRIQNALLCLVALSYPFTSVASIDAYPSDREENILGIEAEWDEDYAYISQLDCTDDIKFDLTIDLNDEDTDGREIDVFAGSNCDDSDDSSDRDDDDFAGTLIVYALVGQQTNAEGDAKEIDGATDAGGVCSGRRCQRRRGRAPFFCDFFLTLLSLRGSSY
jgi:hypothetical protein